MKAKRAEATNRMGGKAKADVLRVATLFAFATLFQISAPAAEPAAGAFAIAAPEGAPASAQKFLAAKKFQGGKIATLTDFSSAGTEGVAAGTETPKPEAEVRGSPSASAKMTAAERNYARALGAAEQNDALQIAAPSAEDSAIPFAGLPKPENVKPVESTEVFARSTACFVVLSEDFEASSSARACAMQAEKIFSSAFGTNLKFIKPVTLQILPASDANLKGDFGVEYGAFGDITISVKWKENLPIEGFCRLLSGAMLGKIGYELCGAKDPSSTAIPRWAYLGFAREIESSILCNLIYNDAVSATESPKPDFAQIMNLSPADSSEKSSIDAFWCVKVLESTLDSGRLTGFYKLALNSASAAQLSEYILRWHKPDCSFEAWWRCMIEGEITSRTGGVLTPESSAAEIKNLSIPAYVNSEGVLTAIVDTQLLDAPKSAAAARAVGLNLRRIKVALSVINPIYYDSLRNLGLMYENALNGDEVAFFKARSDFSASYEAARKLHAKISELMRAGKPELGSADDVYKNAVRAEANAGKKAAKE